MTLLHNDLDYTVQLPVFEGPLDLLLRLIEREELDITAVALAQVADAYLAHVRALVSPDPAALSAFLVLAARLLLIKSRALLPRPPVATAGDSAVDDAETLAQQLREYQRFKQVAALLLNWQQAGRRVFPRLAAPLTPPPPANAAVGVSLGQLIAAFERRLQLQLPLNELPEVAVPSAKVITVAEMAASIQMRLAQQAWLSFEDLLPLTLRRVEVIVALWAVLELLKRRVIVVEQHELFGPILIGRGPALADDRR